MHTDIQVLQLHLEIYEEKQWRMLRDSSWHIRSMAFAPVHCFDLDMFLYLVYLWFCSRISKKMLGLLMIHVSPNSTVIRLWASFHFLSILAVLELEHVSECVQTHMSSLLETILILIISLSMFCIIVALHDTLITFQSAMESVTLSLSKYGIVRDMYDLSYLK